MGDNNDNLSKISPVEFTWDDTTSTIGVIAQDVGSIDINDIDINSYSLTSGAVGAGLTVGHAGISSASNWALSGSNGSTISYYDTLSAGTTEYGKTTIKTAKHTIDIDELADLMQTLKKRLLILTPAFEKHEKYPMLKELYDEYRAMERLLSGPDSNE